MQSLFILIGTRILIEIAFFSKKNTHFLHCVRNSQYHKYLQPFLNELASSIRRIVIWSCMLWNLYCKALTLLYSFKSRTLISFVFWKKQKQWNTMNAKSFDKKPTIDSTHYVVHDLRRHYYFNILSIKQNSSKYPFNLLEYFRSAFCFARWLWTAPIWRVLRNSYCW